MKIAPRLQHGRTGAAGQSRLHPTDDADQCRRGGQHQSDMQELGDETRAGGSWRDQPGGSGQYDHDQRGCDGCGGAGCGALARTAARIARRKGWRFASGRGFGPLRGAWFGVGPLPLPALSGGGGGSEGRAATARRTRRGRIALPDHRTAARRAEGRSRRTMRALADVDWERRRDIQPEHGASHDGQQSGDRRGSIARCLGARPQRQCERQRVRAAIGQLRQRRRRRQQCQGRHHAEQSGQLPPARSEPHATQTRASSATAVRGVRGRPRNATPNSRTAAMTDRPADSAASTATMAITSCRPKPPMRAAASSAWNKQPEAGEAQTGRQYGDAEQTGQGADRGDRHAVNQAAQPVEPSGPGAGLDSTGAQQQQRPAQHVGDQQQPGRFEREQRDVRQSRPLGRAARRQCRWWRARAGASPPSDRTDCSVVSSAARSDPATAAIAPTTSNGTPHQSGCAGHYRSSSIRISR